MYVLRPLLTNHPFLFQGPSFASGAHHITASLSFRPMSLNGVFTSLRRDGLLDGEEAPFLAPMGFGSDTSFAGGGRRGDNGSSAFRWRVLKIVAVLGLVGIGLAVAFQSPVTKTRPGAAKNPVIVSQASGKDHDEDDHDDDESRRKGRDAETEETNSRRTSWGLQDATKSPGDLAYLVPASPVAAGTTKTSSSSTVGWGRKRPGRVTGTSTRKQQRLRRNPSFVDRILSCQEAAHPSAQSG